MRCAVLCIGFLCSLFGKLAPAAEPAERLVRLNVAATDSKGDPVTDLSASDIDLREDGQARPILFFRFAGQKRETLAPRPAEIANHPGPVATAILLDRWNETALTAASAWIDIEAALQHAETVDNLYIYILTNHGDLYPVNSLPGSDADLRAPAASSPSELRSRLDDAVKKLAGMRSVDVLEPVKKINTTLQALDALAGQLSFINGRKNLIWVTHGFPVSLRLPGRDWLELTPQIRTLSLGLSLAEIAMYSVDQSDRGAGAAVGTLSEQTLTMFASLTGGRWYPSNRVSDALKGSIADGRGSYRLAYYSPLRAKDKKERKIRLESSRKGVHLLTREGYFAEDAGPDADSLARAIFTAESHSPFEATEISLRAATSTAAGKLHLAIRIDAADVLLEKQNDKYDGDLAVLFAYYSQGVLKSTAGPARLNFSLSQDEWAQAQKSGLDFSQDATLPAGTGTVRVMVLDRNLFALGSVTLPAPK